MFTVKTIDKTGKEKTLFFNDENNSFLTAEKEIENRENRKVIVSRYETVLLFYFR